ncbi:MAG: hypothetical protein NT062_32750 [Proteobacteria bacterium]|nr:hypothetical protein [Pseudomonadota bacterium]
MIRPLLLALAITAACHRDPAPPPAPVAGVVVQLDCGDRAQPLTVTGELALDDARCGEPWEAWQLQTPRGIELVRRLPDRTAWVRARDGHAIVELRTGATVGTTFVDVTRIDAAHTGADEPPSTREITIARGTRIEHQSAAGLQATYGGRSIRVCTWPTRAGATLEVFGTREASPPGEEVLLADRTSCTNDGVIIRTNRRGEIQLRDATGKVLGQITRVVIGT